MFFIIEEVKETILDFSERTVKDAETTCVEIASEMKKCFRLKDMLNFNVF